MVLVVDDDVERVRDIKAHIPSGDADVALDTKHCASVEEAREILRQHRPDLLVVDLVLPLRRGQQPEPDGGMRLLEDLLLGAEEGRELPHLVLGITKDPGGATRFVERYAPLGWDVLAVDESSEWLKKLAFLVLQLKCAAKLRRRSAIDVLFFAALPEPEMNAIKDLAGVEWFATPSSEFGDQVYRGRLPGGIRAVLASASRIGPYEAGVRVSHLIAAYSPRLVVMSGICASLRKKSHPPCTIVVADAVGDFDSGKYRSVSPAWRSFIPKPSPFQCDAEVVTRAKAVARDAAFKLRVLKRAGETGVESSDLRVEFGSYATGASVVADATLASAVKRRLRNAQVLEMEAYAVALAGVRSLRSRPQVLIAKAVSDYADSRKDDQWRLRAARRSAAFCLELVESQLGTILK